VAVRAQYRPLPEPGVIARVARGFVYVLVVVAFTATAAYGGYVIGSRHGPSEGAVAADQSAAVKVAVAKAVASQKHEDRARRRDALRQFGDFQRQRFAAELQRKLTEQHQIDAEAAARAYTRGKHAGAVVATQKAAAEADQAGAADEAAQPAQ
jgi:hypothetical protein